MLVDCFKSVVLLQLKELFTRNGVNVMLVGKDYQCIDIVFPIICEYVDKDTRYIENTKRTKVNKMYSNTLFEIYSRSSKRRAILRHECHRSNGC